MAKLLALYYTFRIKLKYWWAWNSVHLLWYKARIKLKYW